uniref:Uncharacterized protein n=1 Tax=mine drainage metagenome TaxID=410659 RepID=E6QSK8_9ZZZZ
MIPDNQAGCERMARQVARHFGELADVQGMVYGRREPVGPKRNWLQIRPAAGTRINSKSHLMNDPD